MPECLANAQLDWLQSFKELESRSCPRGAVRRAWLALHQGARSGGIWQPECAASCGLCTLQIVHRWPGLACTDYPQARHAGPPRALCGHLLSAASCLYGGPSHYGQGSALIPETYLDIVVRERARAQADHLELAQDQADVAVAALRQRRQRRLVHLRRAARALGPPCRITTP